MKPRRLESVRNQVSAGTVLAHDSMLSMSIALPFGAGKEDRIILTEIEEDHGQRVGDVGPRSGGDGDRRQQEGSQSPHWSIAESMIVAAERSRVYSIAACRPPSLEVSPMSVPDRQAPIRASGPTWQQALRRLPVSGRVSGVADPCAARRGARGQP